MPKIVYIFLIVIASFSACKQESVKSPDFKSGIDDLEKKYGYLFDSNEDTAKIKGQIPKVIQNAEYQLSFHTIDRNLFNSYLANTDEIKLTKELPKIIKHVDSCFYLNSKVFKDTLCDNLNDDFSDDYIDFHYLGHWDSLNYAVFESGIYEELVYFLYNLENGNRTYLWNIPFLSPSKNFILTFSYDLVAGFQPNGIQLFEINQEKVEKEFELEFQQWGPDSCFWINNNELVFKRIILNFDDYSVEKEEYTLMKISKREV